MKLSASAISPIRSDVILRLFSFATCAFCSHFIFLRPRSQEFCAVTVFCGLVLSFDHMCFGDFEFFSCDYDQLTPAWLQYKDASKTVSLNISWFFYANRNISSTFTAIVRTMNLRSVAFPFFVPSLSLSSSLQ